MSMSSGSDSSLFVGKKSKQKEGVKDILEKLLAKEEKKDDSTKLRGLDEPIGQHDETPLMFAAGYGFIDLVEKFIEKGVDLNSKNKHGYSAVIFAASEGRYDIVRLLLRNGAKFKFNLDPFKFLSNLTLKIMLALDGLFVKSFIKSKQYPELKLKDNVVDKSKGGNGQKFEVESQEHLTKDIINQRLQEARIKAPLQEVGGCETKEKIVDEEDKGKLDPHSSMGV